MFCNEMMFDEEIKNYYEQFLKTVNEIIDIENYIKKGLILPSQENISIKINNSFIDEIIKILEIVNIIKVNLKNYIENIDVLNKGFINKDLNLDIDIPFFREAVNIIENEL